MEAELVGRPADLIRNPADNSLRVLAVIPGANEGSSFIFARRQVESLRKLDLSIDTFYLQSRLSPLAVFREALRLSRTVRELRPDLVHAHYGTLTSCLCALVATCPLVITFRGSDLNGDLDVGFIRAWLGIFLSQISALRARAIICTSRRLESRLWWHKHKVTVLPSGVDLNLFTPISQEKAREKLALPTSERIVLFNAGKNSITKGVALAKAATGHAEESVGKICLLQLDGTVSHQDMPLYMNAADCLLLTSRTEGSPNVVKEAMACNLPVVSVPVGDVPELLEGVSYSHILPRDASDLGKAIAEIVGSRHRSDGRNKIETYSEDNIARQVLAVYQSACLPFQEAGKAAIHSSNASI